MVVWRNFKEGLVSGTYTAIFLGTFPSHMRGNIFYGWLYENK